MILDEVQEAIAHSTEKVFSVFAGAGSGKTRVVCERARWLHENGCDPTDIVILTFTKKAAEEIKERLDDCEGIIAGTFHSVLLQWIKQNPEKLEGFDYGIECVATQEEVEACEKVAGKPFSRRVAAEFQCVSFDMILELGAELLRNMPELMNGAHFIVDEAQDNSAEQWEIVNIIAEHPEIESLMVVGDFRQSIYEWRGAKPESGQEFCGKHKTYYMSKNYRSGKAIVDHSNRVIGAGGFNEPMVPCSGLDGKVIFAEAQDALQYLCVRVGEVIADGVDPEDIAVLCRYNTRADDVARYLRQEHIPAYRKNPTWETVLSRVCAWANLMANPHNSMAWSVAVGGRFNPAEKRLLISESESTGTNFIDLMLVKSIEGVPFTRRLEKFDPDTLRDLWIYCGGTGGEMMEYLATNFSGIDCKEFSERMTMDDRSFGTSGVAVGTIHSFKGLEYDTVFFMNCSQLVMPGGKKGRKKEEERRLAFVAQTRAISQLIYINSVGHEWSEFVCDEHGRFLL